LFLIAVLLSIFMDYILTLKAAFKNYLANFSTVLGFGLLLVFVFLFLQFSNTFISSGSIFVYYNLQQATLISTVLLLFSGIIFLFFYSIFVSLMIFAIRNHLSQVKLHYYLTQKIRKFAVKHFIFSVLLTLFAYLFVFLGNYLNIPTIAIFFVLFLVFSSVIFVPQSLVVDEGSIKASIINNFEFISKNFASFALVLISGIILMIFLVLIEFAVDNFLFIGNILSLLLMFFFLIPFMEALKTQIYLKKFALIVENTSG